MKSILNKHLKKAVALCLVLLMAATYCISGSAAVFVPYSTYTYDYNGETLVSPHAFVPEIRVDALSMKLSTPLNSPGDMFVAPDGNVYIADTGNNRIVIFDKDLQFLGEVSEYLYLPALDTYLAEQFEEDPELEAQLKEEYGKNEENAETWDPMWKDWKDHYYYSTLAGSDEDPTIGALNAPSGVFVTADNDLYIADTGSAKLVHMKKTDDDWTAGWEAVRVIEKPESTLFDENFVFAPTSVVLDSAGRIYTNIKNVNSGILELNSDGEFVAYFGAQKVQKSVIQWFLELFMSEEQRYRQVRTVPRQYNNINIDSNNFIWLTANSVEAFDQYTYLETGDSAIAPLKRLNPSGDDVLKRNGIWAPGGDVDLEVSSLIDVAIKDNGTYTLLDEKRNKLFTYDVNGNLLYAFGGTGSQLGVFTLVGAVEYQGENLLVLDKGTGTITRFIPTDYAKLIEQALDADDKREYAKSEECWQAVHKRNANFDLAYIGLAKNYTRAAATEQDTEKAMAGYHKAMEYYEIARDKEGYSKAFQEYRSLYVREHLLLVLIVPVVLIALIYFATRAMKRINSVVHVTGTPTTLKQELVYGWRAIFHPLNGFWEIKREKRGSFRAATIFLVAAVLAYCYQATGTAYLFRSTDVQQVSLLQEAANVLIPVLLWVLASWALTTLMSGEGSMKDIYIALCYALIPLIIILIPTTLASNILTMNEQAFLTFFVSLAFVWMGLLIVFGSMVIQDYTFSKNLLTVILSVVGMAVIMFLVLLLITLTSKIASFFGEIYQEIALRL